MVGARNLFESDWEKPDTLAAAKREVLANREEGMACPCCGQFAKLYKRPLYYRMAMGLIALQREYEVVQDWVHFPSTHWQRDAGGDFAKLRYWGLIEEMPNDDNQKRTSGYWKPTQAGTDFVYRRKTVPSHVLLYDGEPEGFSGEHIDIVAALGEHFNYGKLMQGDHGRGAD